MKKDLFTSILMTLATTVLLGVVYPLVITGVAQVCFRDKANGQMLVREGHVIGSRIIAQPFTGDAYFHPRPSAAGSGYDAANSGGTNLGPTNSKLISRINEDSQSLRRENSSSPVPIDLVTTSASGLDPHITPEAAYFQVPRVARARGISEETLRSLIDTHVETRQLGLIGEPRVNVLELNLDLDKAKR